MIFDGNNLMGIEDQLQTGLSKHSIENFRSSTKKFKSCLTFFHKPLQKY